MSDYTKSIEDLSSNCQKKIIKDIDTYIKSYKRKIPFKECYLRHLDYFHQSKKLPFKYEDFVKTFKPKNFWKDLNDCGSWLEFRSYQKSDKTKLHRANFCKRDKLCIACAVRRAYKQQNKFMSIIENEPKLKQKDWYYIVLTVKHNKRESYETVMNRVISLKKKIVKSINNSKNGKKTNIWAIFSGGMFAQEVTYNIAGWHVHLNIIINAPKGTKLPLNAVKNKRGQISYQNEDIRQFMIKHFDSQIHQVTKIKDNEKLRDEIVEVLKYSLKFGDLTNQQLIEVFVKTRNVRLFGTFGNLYGKGLENVSLDKDIELDEEFIELIFTRTFNEYKEPEYKLYKREVKQIEKKEDKELVHVFGKLIPNIGKNKSYYNSSPLIIIPKNNGQFNIRKKGMKK